MNRFKFIALAASSLLLAGCGPIIDFGKNSGDKIYTIRYDGAVPALSVSSGSVFVDEFMYTAGLDQDLILVRTPEGQQLSLSGAVWAESPPDMLRDYLASDIRAHAGMRSYGEGSIDIRVGCKLAVKMVDFHYDSMFADKGENKPPSRGKVTLTLDFLMLQLTTGKVLGEVRLHESHPVSSGGVMPIVQAFQQGTKTLSKAAADWSKPFAADCHR